MTRLESTLSRHGFKRSRVSLVVNHEWNHVFIPKNKKLAEKFANSNVVEVRAFADKVKKDLLGEIQKPPGALQRRGSDKLKVFPYWNQEGSFRLLVKHPEVLDVFG